MAYTRKLAQTLLNDTELALYDSGSAASLRELSPARTRQQLGRVRRLRDKQRDLLQRQRLAARRRTGSKAGSGRDNRRTEQKLHLFEELEGRFQRRLDRLQRAEAKSSPPSPAAQLAERRRADTQVPRRLARKRAHSSAAAQAKREAQRAVRSGYMDARAKSRAIQSHLRDARLPAIHGHVSSSDRKGQVRRDQR